MVKRLSGINPLSYMGVEPVTPSQFVQLPRNPTTTDYDNFNLMAVWLNTTTQQIWMLTSKANFVATWREFTSAVGAVNTLTADTGTNPVPPTGNNIDIFGGTGIGTVGTAGSSLITINVDATVALQYDCDTGTATAAANVLNVIGDGTYLSTTGSGNTITIAPSGSVAIQVDGDTGSATPSMGVLNVIGATGRNITTAASGNTLEIAVSGTTNHALQRGNASGSLTSLSVGTNGQVVIGATGADPAFATMTSVGGTILFTPGSNTLNLESSATPVNIICDVDDAHPIAGVLNILGGDNITTTGDTNDTITVAISGTTQYAPQMGNAAGSLDDIGLLADGELIIGSTGAAPQVNTLTAGTGISIMNAAGSITITATGGSTSDTKVTTFNSSGTWTKDANSKEVVFMVCSSGGGGGSGAVTSTPSSVPAVGGQGGNARGMTYYSMPSSLLPASLSITVGAGGSGGAGVTSAITANGNNGGDSSISYFGDVPGGRADTNNFYGAGGGNSFTTTPGFVFYDFSSSNGLNPPIIQPSSFGVPPTIAFGAPTSGGTGGSVEPPGTYGSGFDGGLVRMQQSTIDFGTAAAGGATGVNGTAGADAGAQTTGWMLLGYGGGGGGAHATNPGSGGASGFPGGGGGGGGACSTLGTSGVGADGADGQVIVIEHLGA